MSPKFVKPLYDSSCFLAIPATIESLFESHQKVIFFLVDAFGWKFFTKYKNKYPALQRFLNKGSVSKFTSQFPSTTAAHTTTINTGLSVGQSGVYEWFYYEPKLDAVIAPLLFSFASDKERGTLEKTGINPSELFPCQTIYTKLKKHGIRSSTFVSNEFAASPYNSVVSKGANVYPFTSIAEGLTKLSEKVVKEKGKSYFYLYYGKVDSMGHNYGTSSRYFESEIDLFFTALENTFFKFVEKKTKDTIVILSADHGQTNVNPKTTFYLNKKIQKIAKYFQTTKKGEPIVPAGSCRDMFLYVKEDILDNLSKILAKRLKGKADVCKTQDLIKQGFFGPEISKEFISRVGNLVILPYAGESVWWYEKGVFEQKHIGHHGGLTPEEMEIPFLTLEL